MAKTTEQMVIELLLKTDKAVANLDRLKRGTAEYNTQLLKTIALMEQMSSKTGQPFSKTASRIAPDLAPEIINAKTNAIRNLTQWIRKPSSSTRKGS